MTEPVGEGKKGPVYLGDIWPSAKEVEKLMKFAMDPKVFRANYAKVEKKPGKLWQNIEGVNGDVYDWPSSTYIAEPPFFDDFTMQPKPMPAIRGARTLGIFGDSVTTDHISPAGSISEASPAGQWLLAHGVQKADFNSYGARRGNHQVMMRGTFANPRIRNEMVPGVEGGVSKHYPSGDVAPIYTTAMRYKNEGVPLVVRARLQYWTVPSVKPFVPTTTQPLAPANFITVALPPFASSLNST